MIDCPKCRYLLETHWSYCPLCGMRVVAFTALDDRAVDQAFSGTNKPGDQTGESKEDSAKSGSYGAGVRAQVFEVIVRQAMAGVAWQLICAGPMKVNSISTKEVEEEVRRRRGGGPSTAGVPNRPAPTQPAGAFALPAPSARQRLVAVESVLSVMLEKSAQDDPRREELTAVVKDLQEALKMIEKLENSDLWKQSESGLNQDLERELNRSRQSIKPGDDKGPHHVDWKLK
jgi:hypothetical protein